MFDATMTDVGPRAQAALARLRSILAKLDTAAVAVSGGVDSLTLATVAHEVMGPRVVMHHATSPAVPGEATGRVRRLALTQGWTLDIFDAGEFTDARYRANPVNRCFFCKTNLYGAIAGRTGAVILSGTNLDDLGDYRPGPGGRQDPRRPPSLRRGRDRQGDGCARWRPRSASAASRNCPPRPACPAVSRPVLPSRPRCSGMIEDAEILLRDTLSPRTVRCRVRRAGIVVELGSGVPGGADRREAGGSVPNDVGPRDAAWPRRPAD